MLLPVDFTYWEFGMILFFSGIGSGLFAAPNSTAIMNSVPARQRGQASGMRATFMNAGQVLSIGLFFSLMIFGLSTTLPQSLKSGLTAQNVPTAVAQQVAHEPPVSILFSAFLGYNPMQNLLPPQTLASIPSQNAATLSSTDFFPSLISSPFKAGLVVTFILSMIAYLIAAAASWLRGGRYIHEEQHAVA